MLYLTISLIRQVDTAFTLIIEANYRLCFIQLRILSFDIFCVDQAAADRGNEPSKPIHNTKRRGIFGVLTPKNTRSVTKSSKHNPSWRLLQPPRQNNVPSDCLLICKSLIKTKKPTFKRWSTSLLLHYLLCSQHN